MEGASMVIEPPSTDGAPREADLLDDFTLDLPTKVNEAWHEFSRALSAALAALPAGATLEVTLDPTASGTGDAVYSVSVLADATGSTLTTLAVGNANLPEGFRLGRTAIGDLVALGWSPPGVIDEAGESFGLRLPVSGAPRLAVIITRTMKDVYGAPHPAFLTYVASDADDKPVRIPALGTARPLAVGEEGPAERPASSEGASLPLEARVTLVIARLLKTTPDQLAVDADGDIGIRAGSAMVFVRVRDNPQLVDVFSPVLTDVEPTEKLYVKLSELTNRMPIGRLYCTKETVWASVPVIGRDFQTSHLMLAVQVMTGLADELDDRLQGEFGGKRFFGEGDKVSAKEAAERTGMYL
jgi:hypothetical protein